jgi:hypothetical protein
VSICARTQSNVVRGDTLPRIRYLDTRRVVLVSFTFRLQSHLEREFRIRYFFEHIPNIPTSFNDPWPYKFWNKYKIVSLNQKPNVLYRKKWLIIITPEHILTSIPAFLATKETYVNGCKTQFYCWRKKSTETLHNIYTDNNKEMVMIAKGQAVSSLK